MWHGSASGMRAGAANASVAPRAQQLPWACQPRRPHAALPLAPPPIADATYSQTLFEPFELTPSQAPTLGHAPQVSSRAPRLAPHRGRREQRPGQLRRQRAAVPSAPLLRPARQLPSRPPDTPLASTSLIGSVRAQVSGRGRASGGLVCEPPIIRPASRGPGQPRCAPASSARPSGASARPCRPRAPTSHAGAGAASSPALARQLATRASARDRALRCIARGGPPRRGPAPALTAVAPACPLCCRLACPLSNDDHTTGPVARWPTRQRTKPPFQPQHGLHDCAARRAARAGRRHFPDPRPRRLAAARPR